MGIAQLHLPLGPVESWIFESGALYKDRVDVESRRILVHQNSPDKSGNPLRRRQNFIRGSGFAFGIGMAVIMLSLFGNHGGIGWWLYVTGLCIPAGWAFGFLMWYALGIGRAVPKGKCASEGETKEQERRKSDVGN